MTATLAGLIGGAVALALPEPTNTHEIVAELDGPVGLNSVIVATREHPYGDPADRGSTRYTDPLGATLTVTSRTGEGGCVLRVDGVVVSRQRADDRHRTVTCTWFAT